MRHRLPVELLMTSVDHLNLLLRGWTEELGGDLHEVASVVELIFRELDDIGIGIDERILWSGWISLCVVAAVSNRRLSRPVEICETTLIRIDMALCVVLAIHVHSSRAPVGGEVLER